MGWSKPIVCSFLTTNASYFIASIWLLCVSDKKDEYYKKLREEMKQADKEDKLLERQRRREKRIKQKMKWKKERPEDNIDEEGESEHSASDSEAPHNRKHKKAKIYFGSDDDGEWKENNGTAEVKGDAISLAEQEALALKLLSSMHSWGSSN